MRLIHWSIAPILLIGLGNCTNTAVDQVAPWVPTAVATCLGGLSLEDSVETNLSVDLTNITEGKGSAEARAAIESDFKGYLIEAGLFSESSYPGYVECINQFVP